MKLVKTCMQNKLLWSKKSKQPVSSGGDQYIPLPLAISDNNGLPRIRGPLLSDIAKEQKCYTTTTLETRYTCSSPSIFFNSLPLGWKSECCTLEGMVMINTTPTGSHTTFEDYGNFLSGDLLYHSGFKVPEVHIIFDNPGRLGETPKYFERYHRDCTAQVMTGHLCDEVNGNTIISKPWKANFINLQK